MRVFSPAKVNLFFRVLRKREDGYHDIASLFQAIDLGDFLEFQKGKEEFACDDKKVPLGRDNLIFRAIDLFQQKSGLNFSLKVKLRKNIPMMSGLGGASSNAASTLWALNRIFDTGFPDDTLASWGAEIGSDVPFFFSSGSAYCEGRGEKMKLQKFNPFAFWIAKPHFGLSTKAVFQNHKVGPGSDPDEALKSFAFEEKSLFNDLEESAFSLSPELKSLKLKLKELGFDKVSMTGSGTSFICFGDVATPKLKDVRFYPVRSIARKEDSWYRA